MSKNVSGIISWLKGWFYDKGDVDTALSNKLDKSSSDTGFVKSNGNIVDFGTSATTVAKGNHTHTNLAVTRELVSGDDLNSFTVRGWYNCNNIAHTNINNTPRTTEGVTTSYSYFIVDVEAGTNDSIVTQTLYTFPSGNINSEIFYRKKYSSGWTSWIKIASIDDIPTSLPASQITGLSNVATSGSYNDLNHKPTIPSAYTHPSTKQCSHSHGSLANAGTLDSDITSVNKVAVTDSSNNLKTIQKVPFVNLNITRDNIIGLGIPGSDTNTTYSADNNTLQLISNQFSVKDKGITNAKIADTTIETGKIKDNAITTGKIKDANVTTAKVANGNITLAKLNNNVIVPEYIVGTQTASTSAWTGASTRMTSLNVGQVIWYKLPFASTSTAVTLDLTLADGTTTGTKNVFFWNGQRVTTHYGINSVVGLVYNGSEWWVINPSSNNTYDYLRVATRIVSGESSQIPANRIIAGSSDSKYYIIKSGLVLDIRYPILFNASAINSNSYTDNTYISHAGVDLRNNVSGKAVTSQKQVFIEGSTYSKGKFTVSSNVFVSDDNLTNNNYYIYIGASYSTTNIRFNSFHQTVYKKTSDGLIPVGQSYNDLLDKPSTFTPSSHTHGNLQNDGKVGTSNNASKNVVTDANGKLTTENKYSHPNSGVTAGSNYNGNQTPSFDSTFSIPKLTFDAQGHITASANSTVKIPALPIASTSTAGIIKIGTGSTNASAGNHTHTNLDIVRQLVSGDNLNNIIDRGWYECYNISSNNITNTPSSSDGVTSSYSNFMLDIEGGSHTALVTQTLYTIPSSSNQSEIFYRKKYSGGWTSWLKIATTPHSHTKNEITNWGKWQKIGEWGTSNGWNQKVYCNGMLVYVIIKTGVYSINATSWVDAGTLQADAAYRPPNNFFVTSSNDVSIRLNTDGTIQLASYSGTKSTYGHANFIYPYNLSNNLE